jgi:hypothetical protein
MLANLPRQTPTSSRPILYSDTSSILIELPRTILASPRPIDSGCGDSLTSSKHTRKTARRLSLPAYEGEKVQMEL